MQGHEPVTCAAIDIGSNSTHLVVALCTPDHLDIIADESRLLRLGESVTQKGEISQEMCDATLATVRQYQAMARQHEARAILVVATEALRTARNRESLLEAIQGETGLQVNIISGTTEAALTFYGAASAPDISANAGVLDIGGGSTELITGHQKRIAWLVSFPIGSGWLHDRYLSSNPPKQDEVEKAREFLYHYLQALRVPESPSELIVTGSSAPALLQLAQQALKLDAHTDRLTHEDVLACQGLLHTLSAEEIAQRYGQQIERVRVLPGGALLLLDIMEYLNLNAVRVSSHGLREGILLAYARYGENWLDHPEVKIDEGRQGQAPPLPEEAREQVGEETFAHAGRRALRRRAKKFLRWRDDVLSQKDIEAVHKMRVASRRLRATLDAYEMACKPKRFKKVYRQTKKVADLLGAARDTDTMIQQSEGWLEQAPEEEKAGRQWLLERLHTLRQRQQQQLQAFLQGLDVQALKSKAASCIPKGAASDGKS
jgi:exopolyphosphatase/pppGpp-phosphohydrolase